MTGVDMVDNLHRGLVDPLGTLPYSCVQYQAGILPTSETGAIKTLPCATVPVCSNQVHYNHDHYERGSRAQDRIHEARAGLVRWKSAVCLLEVLF